MEGIRGATAAVVGSIGFAAVVACGQGPSSSAAAEAESGSADGGGEAAANVSAAGDAGALTGAAIKAKRPQLVFGGGKVLSAPKIQVIRYQGDALADTAESLVEKIGTSAWWAATTKEYGVAGATALPPVTLENPTAAVDDADVQAFLVEHLGAADGVLATPTDDTLYVYIAPDGVKVTDGAQTGCDAFGGYHSEVAVGGRAVPYVVLPRCATFLDQSGAAEVTFTLAHEIVEAAINPRPDSAPAFHLGAGNLPWRLAAGGGDEAADLCALPENAITPPDLGFTVPRSWSNAAAAAGTFPCVPADGVVDVFVEPDEPDTATWEGTTYPAVKIAAGQTRTVTLHFSASSASTEVFTVGAEDAASTMFKLPAEVAAAFDNGKSVTIGKSGDAVQLKVTTLARTDTTDTSPSVLMLVAISQDKKVVTLRPLVIGR